LWESRHFPALRGFSSFDCRSTLPKKDQGWRFHLLAEAPRLRRSTNKATPVFALPDSIHVEIRLEGRRLVLRATRLASDEGENVQNGGDTAKVSRNTYESIFHAGMPVCQGFNIFAHTSEAIDFEQKILEGRIYNRSIGCRDDRVILCGFRLCRDVRLKA